MKPTYKKMNKKDQATWKRMFQSGDSFKKIEEFFNSRKESPFNVEDIFGKGLGNTKK